jgi:hypothetical protein
MAIYFSWFVEVLCMHNKCLIIQLNMYVSKTHPISNWFCIDKNTRGYLDIFLPLRITWSCCIHLSFLHRLLFGSFSNDFRHFTLSLTVLLYLFWHSRFDQSFVLSSIAITFVIDPRNPHWGMPNITKVDIIK